MDPVSVVIGENMNRKSRLPNSDDEGQGALDVGSVLSGGSGRSKVTIKEDRGITCKDIRAIMPTVLILLLTIFIMVTVIPYAFSSVIKQLQAVSELEAQQEAVSAGQDAEPNQTQSSQ
ncbi:uncharacterized protein LOC111702353 isoform X2 [Eurytemora carolleeae]|uniref:uncharacterized protein LOC111702353 isoform X2 n=1 Tax=Eurytemora carolleeae TaxID=1294199 RepID=UPI000C75D940|nr:uncharacterized protein LOC111702353 isoform X2 [Eurytemora carolleeae]|eukprot:XP_023329780.1 uncharacterized protein LOC111702353 isoform X2 [Eurytemora affinis]